MGDHVVLNVDSAPEADERMPLGKVSGSSEESNASSIGPALPRPLASSGRSEELGVNFPEEEEPLIQTVECRICQEEDNIKNLDNPCACSGSLKYAHKECVQKWVNEKGDLTCEICHEQYKPGYIAPPRAQPDDTTIDISGGWPISGTPLDLHDPRLLAMAATQRHFLESEYDEYAASNASGAAFCRLVALILLALLLLRHALTITNRDEDDDASTFFSLFLLRAAGFLLPCYIMAWAISILQRRRQRQEQCWHKLAPEAAAAMAATEVAFILQSGQARGLQFTIAPESPATPVTPQHEVPQREPQRLEP